MPDGDLDPYALLGVARDASLLEIARARRRLAKRMHPDVTSDTDAGARMQALNLAWEILSDPAKRTEWDRIDSGRAWQPPPSPGWYAAAGRTSETWQEWPARPSAGAGAGQAGGSSGLVGWIVLVLVILLMLVIVVGGAISAASREPRPPDSVLRDNLDP